MAETRRRSLDPKKRSPLDWIRVQDMGYSRVDLPWGSDFSRLQADPKNKKKVNERKIEYLTPLNTSTWNMFMQIEDKRILP
ncbi:hypothetical protein LIER_13658 [Lithospermum erythrorhizon]|uniref:Uncharacterized protein n=1 Tax=Lithospermum erythrorhizon TaxID=34254 RepID=A0AAV3PX38_LITER